MQDRAGVVREIPVIGPLVPSEIRTRCGASRSRAIHAGSAERRRRWMPRRGWRTGSCRRIRARERHRRVALREGVAEDQQPVAGKVTDRLAGRRCVRVGARCGAGQGWASRDAYSPGLRAGQRMAA